MNRPAPLLAALLLTGCMTPTWKTHAVGAALGADRVILVGSFASVPPLTQERRTPYRAPISPGGTVADRVGGGGPTMLVGSQAGNLMAFFTPDTTEKMRQSINRMPFDVFDWAWVPLEGAFAIEVPIREHVYLRGMQYYTKGDEGAVRFELPARIELRPTDRVVYVGEIRVAGTGERRATFADRRAETRKALEAAGYKELVALPWRTQLFAQ